MNYKINYKLLALCYAITVTLLGCDKASTPSDPTTDTQSITVTMPKEDTGVVTRAGDAVAEAAIKSAYIIIYAKGAPDATLPKFTAIIDVKEITTDAVNVNNKVVTFPKNEAIVAGDDVRIVFNHALTSLAITKGGLKEALKISTSTSVSSAGLVDISKGLPMYGAGSWGSNVKGGTTIRVKRGVAKVQLLLDYRGGKHVEGVMGSSYTTANTTFKLYQLSNVGYVDGSAATSTGSVAIDKISNVAEINQPTVSSAMVDNFTGASYIFAYPYSTQSIGTTPAKFPNTGYKSERIAMIMKNKTATGDIYHRLDICDPSTKVYLDIKNNFHYIIKLREVNVGGYKDVSEALINPPSNIQYDIIVEEEGDVVISNGQYLLNVDTKGSDFYVEPASGKEEAVKVAVVNLIDSKDAPLTKDPSFTVSLEEYFRVSLATNDVVLTPPSNTTLGKSPKNLNIKAKGTGAVSLRYTATLGNIVHTSNLITIGSNFGVVPASVNGETLVFNVKSLLHGGDWSVESDSPDWAPATRNGDKLNIVVTANDLVDARDRTAKITVSNNKDATVVITITQISFPFFADRNIGVSFDLTTEEELCLPANSRPRVISNWANEEPRLWFTWAESLTLCDNWKYQGVKWRMPNLEDFTLLNQSKTITFGLHRAAKHKRSDGVTIYFPVTGFSYSHSQPYGYFWSSTPNINAIYAHYFWVGQNSYDVTFDRRDYGFGVRCVRA